MLAIIPIYSTNPISPVYLTIIVESRESMTALNPAKFVREVQQEMKRVTWPTRKETVISTVTVLVVVVIASTFFLLVDVLAGSIIRSIIGI